MPRRLHLRTTLAHHQGTHPGIGAPGTRSPILFLPRHTSCHSTRLYLNRGVAMFMNLNALFSISEFFIVESRTNCSSHRFEDELCIHYDRGRLCAIKLLYPFCKIRTGTTESCASCPDLPNLLHRVDPLWQLPGGAFALPASLGPGILFRLSGQLDGDYRPVTDFPRHMVRTDFSAQSECRAGFMDSSQPGKRNRSSRNLVGVEVAGGLARYLDRQNTEWPTVLRHVDRRSRGLQR